MRVPARRGFPRRMPGVLSMCCVQSMRPRYALAFVNPSVEDFCGPILNALDGVLTITRVDGYSVLGSFNFFAQGISVEAPRRVISGDASGRFEAVYERPSLVVGRGLDLR